MIDNYKQLKFKPSSPGFFPGWIKGKEDQVVMKKKFTLPPDFKTKVNHLFLFKTKMKKNSKG